MTDHLLLKHDIETFLYQEADYCDNWQLQEWLNLWVKETVLYQVGPLGVSNAQNTSPKDILYLISDNRFRLEQRVIRMLKPTAHAEWPIRSKLRHNYSNFRNIQQDGNIVSFEVNMLLSRTREDTEGVSIIPGHIFVKLERQDSDFKLLEKRIFLDLHTLTKPGTMSIII